MRAILHNERGMTLIEVMATAIIVSVAMISLYMGIIYADKQVQRNYHDRVATLAASGEIEWQMYYKKNYKVFDTFTNRTVVLDRMERGRTLNGVMSSRVVDALESPFGSAIPYSILEVSVTWTEPGDNRTRKIVIREDFY